MTATPTHDFWSIALRIPHRASPLKRTSRPRPTTPTLGGRGGPAVGVAAGPLLVCSATVVVISARPPDGAAPQPPEAMLARISVAASWKAFVPSPPLKIVW